MPRNCLCSLKLCRYVTSAIAVSSSEAARQIEMNTSEVVDEAIKIRKRGPLRPSPRIHYAANSAREAKVEVVVM